MLGAFPTKRRIIESFVLTLAAMLLSAGVSKAAEPAAQIDFTSAAAVLEQAIEERVFPGCAVAVGASDGPLWRAGFGRLDYEHDDKVTADTLYDMASLTKVVATTTVVMKLVAGSQLRLDDPVSRWLPEFLEGFDDPERGQRRLVTVEHLLTHSSGLPAWRPLYQTSELYEDVLAAVVSSPLDAEPGAMYRYSDLGYILLGELAARVGKKPLAQLEQELVFAPLDMRDTLRNPAPALHPRTAPTEQTSPDSGEFHRGVVHDENARAGQGRTGHAGLFSTANDLARFATGMLAVLDGGEGPFPREELALFVRRREIVAASSRALGWDTPSGDSSAGELFSRQSFGHTGFTGTSMWFDPERDLYVILLTNRVHPTRENSRIHPVRRQLADAVARAFDARAGQ